MVKSCICESFRIVHSLVQPYDGGDIVGHEVREVVFGGVERVAVLNPALVVRASKSQELPCIWVVGGDYRIRVGEKEGGKVGIALYRISFRGGWGAFAPLKCFAPPPPPPPPLLRFQTQTPVNTALSHTIQSIPNFLYVPVLPPPPPPCDIPWQIGCTMNMSTPQLQVHLLIEYIDMYKTWKHLATTTHGFMKHTVWENRSGNTQGIL